MKHFIFILFLLSCLTTLPSAEMIEVKSGFGIFKDADGNIISKAELSKGEHPMKDGFTYEEVSNKNKLDAIDVFKPPASQEQLDEQKIQEQMREIAVEEIKKQNPNFKDPRKTSE